MPKWLKIVALTVGVIIVVAKFAPQIGSGGGGGWNIDQEQDKLTDVVETIATRVYPADDDGEIDVTAKCLGGGINFEFAHFAKGETGKQGDEESAYELAPGSAPRHTLVRLQYRLDDEPVKNAISTSDYVNEASLYFFDRNVSLIPNEPNTIARDLVLAKLLRVRLPLQHGREANLAIHPADLHELFVNCPGTKALPEPPAASKDLTATTEPESCRDAREQMRQLAINDSGLAALAASLLPPGGEVMDKALDERFRGQTAEQCTALMPKLTNGLATLTRTP